MNTELPLYQGAMPQAPQQQFAQVPQLPRLQMHGEQLDNAIAAGLNAVDKYADLHDFGVRQEAEHQLRQNELEMQQDFERKSRLAPGAEGSFFTADGHLNEDAVAVFTDKWQQRNREVARSFWKRENAMRGEEHVLVQNDRLAGNVGLNLLKMESRHRAQAFKDNYDLAVAQGDTAGAVRIINDAVSSGQITEARGNVMKLGLARSGFRAAGASAGAGQAPITINGEEYDGVSAALAAQAAKDGWTPEEEDPENKEKESDGRQEDPPGEGMTEVDAEDAGGLQAASTPMSGNARVTNTLTETAVNPDLYATFFDTGDFGSVLPLIPQQDVEAFTQDVMLQGFAIRPELNPDGSTRFSCSSTTPEAVERAAAQADAQGGLTPESARSMVASISLTLFAGNPEIAPGTVVSVFKDSGVYEALGEGDAEVGKAMVEGMVKEIQERSTLGTTKLGMESIKRMVDAHVAGKDFRMDGEREWHDKTWKAPYYDPGNGKYGKPDKKESRDAYDRWIIWYSLYTKYRHQFDLKLTGEVSDAEFERNAKDFYEWYMKGPYKQMREADANAAKDWYVAEITKALMENMVVDDSGKVAYAGYANDVAVAREVLQRKPPVDLGVDALMKLRTEQEKKSDLLTRAFRQKAEAQFENLRNAKAAVAENNDKTRKEKERQEKAEERRADKEARAAEAAEERKRIQRLNVERGKPREAGWIWDGRNAGQGSVPTCTLPESELTELYDKLGYDGTQNVYLQIEGAKILVTGSHKGDNIRLNSTAVAKLQGKRKKGDKLKLQGKIGYSYCFKTLNDQ